MRSSLNYLIKIVVFPILLIKCYQKIFFFLKMLFLRKVIGLQTFTAPSFAKKKSRSRNPTGINFPCKYLSYNSLFFVIGILFNFIYIIYKFYKILIITKLIDLDGSDSCMKGCDHLFLSLTICRFIWATLLTAYAQYFNLGLSCPSFFWCCLKLFKKFFILHGRVMILDGPTLDHSHIYPPV